MATLVVFKFPTDQGAETMLSTLVGLQKQQLIQIQDGTGRRGRPCTEK